MTSKMKWTPSFMEQFARELLTHEILLPSYKHTTSSKKSKCRIAQERRAMYSALGLSLYSPWTKIFLAKYRKMLTRILTRAFEADWTRAKSGGAEEVGGTDEKVDESFSADEARVVKEALPPWMILFERHFHLVGQVVDNIRVRASRVNPTLERTTLLTKMLRGMWATLRAGPLPEGGLNWYIVAQDVAKQCRLELAPVFNIWNDLRRVSMQKLLLHQSLGDYETARGGAAMRVSDWLTADLLLLYDDTQGLLREHTLKDTDQESLFATLMSLVHSYGLRHWLLANSDDHTDTHTHTAEERWRAATHAYHYSGRTSSMVVLQRRWWEFVTRTRAILTAALSGRRAVPPICTQLALRFPTLLTAPVLCWREMVDSGRVYSHDYSHGDPPHWWKMGPPPPPLFSSDDDHPETIANDDIILVERDIETIDLDASDDETGTQMEITYKKLQKALVDRKKQNINDSLDKELESTLKEIESHKNNETSPKEAKFKFHYAPHSPVNQKSRSKVKYGLRDRIYIDYNEKENSETEQNSEHEEARETEAYSLNLDFTDGDSSDGVVIIDMESNSFSNEVENHNSRAEHEKTDRESNEDAIKTNLNAQSLDDKSTQPSVFMRSDPSVISSLTVFDQLDPSEFEAQIIFSDDEDNCNSASLNINTDININTQATNLEMNDQSSNHENIGLNHSMKDSLTQNLNVPDSNVANNLVEGINIDPTNNMNNEITLKKTAIKRAHDQEIDSVAASSEPKIPKTRIGPKSFMLKHKKEETLRKRVAPESFVTANFDNLSKDVDHDTPVETTRVPGNNETFYVNKESTEPKSVTAMDLDKTVIKNSLRFSKGEDSSDDEDNNLVIVENNDQHEMKGKDSFLKTSRLFFDDEISKAIETDNVHLKTLSTEFAKDVKLITEMNVDKKFVTDNYKNEESSTEVSKPVIAIEDDREISNRNKESSNECDDTSDHEMIAEGVARNDDVRDENNKNSDVDNYRNEDNLTEFSKPVITIKEDREISNSVNKESLNECDDKSNHEMFTGSVARNDDVQDERNDNPDTDKYNNEDKSTEVSKPVTAVEEGKEILNRGSLLSSIECHDSSDHEMISECVARNDDVRDESNDNPDTDKYKNEDNSTEVSKLVTSVEEDREISNRGYKESLSEYNDTRSHVMVTECVARNDDVRDKSNENSDTDKHKNEYSSTDVSKPVTVTEKNKDISNNDNKKSLNECDDISDHEVITEDVARDVNVRDESNVNSDTDNHENEVNLSNVSKSVTAIKEEREISNRDKKEPSNECNDTSDYEMISECVTRNDDMRDKSNENSDTDKYKNKDNSTDVSKPVTVTEKNKDISNNDNKKSLNECDDISDHEVITEDVARDVNVRDESNVNSDTDNHENEVNSSNVSKSVTAIEEREISNRDEKEPLNDCNDTSDHEMISEKNSTEVSKPVTVTEDREILNNDNKESSECHNDISDHEMITDSVARNYDVREKSNKRDNATGPDTDKLLMSVRIPLTRVDELATWRRHAAHGSIDVSKLAPTSKRPTRRKQVKRLRTTPELTVRIDRLPLHIVQGYLEKQRQSSDDDNVSSYEDSGLLRPRKKVELSDIDEVRRINRRLATAQVKPLASSAQTSDTESYSESDDGTDSETEPQQVDTPPLPPFIRRKPVEIGVDSTLTPQELGEVLDKLKPKSQPKTTQEGEGSKQASKHYCCPARRHIILNRARARIAARAGRQAMLLDIHPCEKEGSTRSCKCCCLKALRTETQAAFRLTASLKDLYQNLKHLRSTDKIKEMSKRKYTIEHLNKALDNITKGTMTVMKASQVYKIPNQTLYAYFIKEKKPENTSTVFTSSEETLLAEWINYMAENGTPVTKNQFNKAVARLLVDLKRSNPFKEGVPGKNWYDSFLKRNPSLDKGVFELAASNANVSGDDVKEWFQRARTIFDGEDKFLDILEDLSLENCGSISSATENVAAYSAPSASDDSDFEPCPRLPNFNPHTHGKTNQKKRNRKKKTTEDEVEETKEDNDYAEWQRQRNICAKYFTINPTNSSKLKKNVTSTSQHKSATSTQVNTATVTAVTADNNKQSTGSDTSMITHTNVANVSELETQMAVLNIPAPDRDLLSPNIQLQVPNVQIQAPNLNLQAPNSNQLEPNLNLQTPNLNQNAPNQELIALNIQIPRMDAVPPSEFMLLLQDAQMLKLKEQAQKIDLRIPEPNALISKLTTQALQLDKERKPNRIPDTSVPDIQMVESNVHNVVRPTPDFQAPNAPITEIKTQALEIEVPKLKEEPPEMLESSVQKSNSNILLPEMILQAPKVETPDLNTYTNIEEKKENKQVENLNIQMPVSKAVTMQGVRVYAEVLKLSAETPKLTKKMLDLNEIALSFRDKSTSKIETDDETQESDTNDTAGPDLSTSIDLTDADDEDIAPKDKAAAMADHNYMKAPPVKIPRAKFFSTPACERSPLSKVMPSSTLPPTTKIPPWHEKKIVVKLAKDSEINFSNQKLRSILIKPTDKGRPTALTQPVPTQANTSKSKQNQITKGVLYVKANNSITESRKQVQHQKLKVIAGPSQTTKVNPKQLRRVSMTKTSKKIPNQNIKSHNLDEINVPITQTSKSNNLGEIRVSVTQTSNQIPNQTIKSHNLGDIRFGVTPTSDQIPCQSINLNQIARPVGVSQGQNGNIIQVTAQNTNQVISPSSQPAITFTNQLQNQTIQQPANHTYSQHIIRNLNQNLIQQNQATVIQNSVMNQPMMLPVLNQNHEHSITVIQQPQRLDNALSIIQQFEESTINNSHSSKQHVITQLNGSSDVKELWNCAVNRPVLKSLIQISQASPGAQFMTVLYNPQDRRTLTATCCTNPDNPSNSSLKIIAECLNEPQPSAQIIIQPSIEKYQRTENANEIPNQGHTMASNAANIQMQPATGSNTFVINQQPEALSANQLSDVSDKRGTTNLAYVTHKPQAASNKSMEPYVINNQLPTNTQNTYQNVVRGCEESIIIYDDNGQKSAKLVNNLKDSSMPLLMDDANIPSTSNVSSISSASNNPNMPSTSSDSTLPLICNVMSNYQAHDDSNVSEGSVIEQPKQSGSQVAKKVKTHRQSTDKEKHIEHFNEKTSSVMNVGDLLRFIIRTRRHPLSEIQILCMDRNQSPWMIPEHLIVTDTSDTDSYSPSYWTLQPRKLGKFTLINFEISPENQTTPTTTKTGAETPPTAQAQESSVTPMLKVRSFAMLPGTDNALSSKKEDPTVLALGSTTEGAKSSAPRALDSSEDLVSADGKCFKKLADVPLIYAQVFYVVSTAPKVDKLINEGAQLYLLDCTVRKNLVRNMKLMPITKESKWLNERAVISLSCPGATKPGRALVQMLNRLHRWNASQPSAPVRFYAGGRETDDVTADSEADDDVITVLSDDE